MAREIPIVSFVGRSGCGKTTLLEKVVRELKARGYRLAVIKHHRHSGIQFDVPGKDSYRFAEAGADHVVFAAPGTVIHRRRVDHDPSLAEAAAGIQDADLIITEGYKQAGAPKIEVNRQECSEELIFGPEDLMAVVSDQCFDIPVPQFDLEDVQGVVGLVEERFLR